jgi:hypothetical protein
MVHAVVRRADSFVVSDAFRTLVLLLGPLVVFIAGLMLALRAPFEPSLGVSFLGALGGLFLCVGALTVYAVFVARHASKTQWMRDGVHKRVSASQQVIRLGMLLVGFLVTWIIHSLYGFSTQTALSVLFTTLFVVFGMAYVSLAAYVLMHRAN